MVKSNQIVQLTFPCSIRTSSRGPLGKIALSHSEQTILGSGDAGGEL